jgi:hypothetical protein
VFSGFNVHLGGHRLPSIKAMFVFWKVIFEKLFFKFFCVYLPLENLVNEKYFPVKEKFGLVSRKVFS